MTKADKRIEWKARFDAWKSSGMSVAEWCREQEVKTHQMYYWIRNFEDDVTSEQGLDTQWLTVNLDDKSTTHPGQEPVFIHFGPISVEVRPGANMALLSDVVHVLQNK